MEDYFCNVNEISNENENALHIACGIPSVETELIELLVKNTAINLSLRNKRQYTPLDILHILHVSHYRINAKKEMIELLSRYGATLIYSIVDPFRYLQNSDAHSPVFIAITYSEGDQMLHLVFFVTGYLLFSSCNRSFTF